MFKIGGQIRFTSEAFQFAAFPVTEIRHDRHCHFTVGIPVMHQKDTLHSAETDTADKLITGLRFQRQTCKILIRTQFPGGGSRDHQNGLAI